MPCPKPADYPFWMRAMVVATLAMFVVVLFYFLIPAGGFIAWLARNLDAKDAVAAVGALAGSFFGAWFAFRFARIQREKEGIENSVATGNLALFTLSEMWNELRQHQKEVVEPWRGKPDAWLNLPESQPLTENLSLEMKELSFVMQHDATTFQQCLLEQRRFQHAAYVIEQHRSILLSMVIPRLEAAGLQVGQGLPLAEFERIIGGTTVHRLKIITAAIITNLDDGVRSSRDAFVKLRAALKTIFPDRGFIDFNPD